jgi:hypothetical protein
VRNLFIEFIEHANENDGNRKPLPVVDGVVKDEDTQNDSNHLSGRRNEREYMLLEIGHNIINTDLTDHLKQSDFDDIDKNTGIVAQEFDRREKRLINEDRVQ